MLTSDPPHMQKYIYTHMYTHGHTCICHTQKHHQQEINACNKIPNQETFLVLSGYYFDLLSVVVIEYPSLRKEAVLCSWSAFGASQGTEQLRALQCFNS